MTFRTNPSSSWTWSLAEATAKSHGDRELTTDRESRREIREISEALESGFGGGLRGGGGLKEEEEEEVILMWCMRSTYL